jgi:hypothetical protein
MAACENNASHKNNEIIKKNRCFLLMPVPGFPFIKFKSLALRRQRKMFNIKVSFNSGLLITYMVRGTPAADFGLA